MVSIRKKKSIAALRARSVNRPELPSSSQQICCAVEPSVAAPGSGQVSSSTPVPAEPQIVAVTDGDALRDSGKGGVCLTPVTLAAEPEINGVPDTGDSAQSLKKRKRISSIERDHDRGRYKEWDGDEPMQPPPGKLQSIFRGVYKAGSKWVTHIRVNGNTIYLGAFFSEVEAARLYDRAASICKRPSNFIMTDEEKMSLENMTWEEFLSKTKQQMTLLGKLSSATVLARQENKDRAHSAVEPPRRTTALRGVFSTGRKWVAHIRVDGSTVFLGVVSTEEEASHLFDRAAYVRRRSDCNAELAEEEKEELDRMSWKDFLRSLVKNESDDDASYSPTPPVKERPVKEKVRAPPRRPLHPQLQLQLVPYENGADHDHGNGVDVKKLKEKSEYRGVYKNNSKWQAGIKVNGKQLHLGTVSSEDDAAHLYDRAAYILGRDTNLPLPSTEKEDLDNMTWEEFISSTKGGMQSKRAEALKRRKK